MKQISVRGPIVSDEEKWIYDWFEMPCTTPGDFLTQLEEAAGDDVLVVINSVGGYVAQAAEIYEAIRSYTGKVTGKVIGQACSCASFIACAMYCEISPIGEIFIHNCSGGMEGDYRAMQQAKDALMQTNDNIILAYQEKTGLSREELQTMMDNSTTLSAREAVRLGFVDKISDNSNYDTQIDDKGMVAAVGGVLPVANLSAQKRMALLAVARGKPLLAADSHLSQIQEQEVPMGNLSDFLASNHDANNEYQTLIENAKTKAREEGIAQERERLSAIDRIAGNVSQTLVHHAKYVEPVTAEQLALKALQDGAVAAGAVQQDETAAGTPADPAQPQQANGNAAINMEQLARMAADYAISNIAATQSPAKHPLTGEAGSGNHTDQMAKDASASISKFL